MSADKARAIGNQAMHCVPDAGMFVSAGINAVVLGPASNEKQSRTCEEPSTL